jgi:hypothetical protein
VVEHSIRNRAVVGSIPTGGSRASQQKQQAQQSRHDAHVARSRA